MDLRKEINKINNERLPNSNRTDRLIKLFNDYHQALQLQQTGINSCCDMFNCMKLPKCSKQCKDCASVQ